jgi:hypothetical protein
MQGHSCEKTTVSYDTDLCNKTRSLLAKNLRRERRDLTQSDRFGIVVPPAFDSVAGQARRDTCDLWVDM